MELRHLRYLVAVAQHGSFSHAARFIYVSQSAISEQIADLEQELGVPLFDRSRRRIRLTAHGELFLREAKAVLAAADRAVDVARQSFHGEIGTLRIAFFSGGFGSELPALIRDFRSSNANVRVSLTEMTPVEQTRALLNGSLDVGFTRRVEERFSGDLRSEVLYQHRIMAVLPSNHPLAPGPVDIRALKTERFVLCARETSPVLFDKVIELCSKAGFSPSIAGVSTVWASVVMLVQAGEGVSLLPDLQQSPAGEVVFCPLTETDATVDLVLAWSAARQSPILDAFLKLVRETGMHPGS